MNEFFKKPVVKILMLKGEKGDKGNTGTGTPAGGKTGQYLLKKSDADYDYVWSAITTVSWDNVSGKPDATTSASGLMSAADKAKLDNLQVGGRNLLLNSGGAFTMGSGIPETTWNESTGKSEISLPVTAIFGEVLPQQSSFNINYKFSVGGTYTQSITVETDANIKGNIPLWTWFDADLIVHHQADCKITSVGNVYVFSSTYTIGNGESGNVRIMDIYNLTSYFNLETGTYLCFYHPKIERGTVATDWTPAPEDFNSVTKNFTLSASSWSSGSYTISDSLITASSNQEVLPATNITADQMKALQKANIIDSGQSAGSLTLKALGTVPTIDIPIRVIFRGTI